MTAEYETTNYNLCISCILWHDCAWQPYCGNYKKRNASEFPLFSYLVFVQHFSLWCPEAFVMKKNSDYFWAAFWENHVPKCPQMWQRALLDNPFASEDALRYQNSSCWHILFVTSSPGFPAPTFHPCTSAPFPMPCCLPVGRWKGCKQWWAAREDSVWLMAFGGVQWDCSNSQSNFG